jgi:hypothetical protein
MLVTTLVSSMNTSFFGSSLGLPSSQRAALGRDVWAILFGGV